jgi:hypothetical protein
MLARPRRTARANHAKLSLLRERPRPVRDGTHRDFVAESAIARDDPYKQESSGRERLG